MCREAPHLVLSPYELADLRRLARPTPPRRPSPSAPASSFAAPRTRTRPTTRWPWNWTATPTRSPAGAAASTGTASPVCPTCPAAAARPLFPPQERHQVLVLATTRPTDVGVPTAQWSLDDLAYHILREVHYRDMSRSTIQRILDAADLKPHKSQYWLHSDDPQFEAKALDICRLYLDAPRLYQQGDLVVCVDEKTGMQALEQARPTTPGRPGSPERRDPEYIRHGTRCLIASLVAATGQVVGSVTAQRKTWDFVRHLRDVVVQFPDVQRFHWVMDNLNTHYTYQLCQYLGKLSGVWDERPPLRTGAQRRAFLSDPSPPACRAFHAHAWQLAEPDRDLVRGAEPQTAAQGKLRQRGGVGGARARVLGALQPTRGGHPTSGPTRADRWSAGTAESGKKVSVRPRPFLTVMVQ